MSLLSNPEAMAGITMGILFILTFAMSNMLPLRILALLASLSVLVHGWLSHSRNLLVFGAIILAINLYRYFQIQNVSRRIRRTRHYGYDLETVLPLMTKMELTKGDLVFAKGDSADKLYVLVSGKVKIIENNTLIKQGAIFGEFGLFTNSGTRTSSARCESDCVLRSMTSDEVDRLYFQKPEFGFALVKTIATRMATNIEHLEEELTRKNAQN